MENERIVTEPLSEMIDKAVQELNATKEKEATSSKIPLCMQQKMLGKNYRHRKEKYTQSILAT